jgi:dynein heavy chain
MHACVGKEYVAFTDDLSLMGKVEVYFQDIIDIMRKSLKDISKKSLKRFGEVTKETWLLEDPAQVTLLINVCSWVISVEKAFLEIGTNPKSIKACYADQHDSLKALILMVQGDLTKSVRQKIMCLITMDSHSRDIIGILDAEGVVKQDEF